jgi:AraC family transcriptional regulator
MRAPGISAAISRLCISTVPMNMRRVGEQIWDRSPASFSLQEQTFSSDDKITAVYRQFLLDNDWQQQANQLTLSSASTLLLTHLIQHYSNVQWRLPTVTGGLAPHVCAICWRGLRSISISR